MHTSSKSSGFTISAGINSPALDRAKQAGQAVSQIKNGDTAGGAMEAINAATGTIKGLADNQGTRQTNYVNGSVGAKGARDAMANSNFYANIGVNAGFTRSRSNSSAHTEGAAVTTLKPMDENSSITYNNVNNITYQGTQAQGGTFIYNNVANIQKEAVELHNSYSSSSSSRGINAGATIGYGHKIQTTGNGGSISASQSNQNTVETVYANGNFKNVNEVHNNTGSMVLNGFNQEGGKLTGNIGKVEVISRQNTSTTTGSSSGISLGISANGVPSSVNINGSRTNGSRAFVDNQSTFIVGEGSNLHVGTLENTGAVVGKEGNSTFKIDSYIGKDIQNHDTMKTTGGSIGISTGKPRITNVGFNQDSRDKQGITRNTVVGDVEIEESSGSPINRDLGKANEVTRDTRSSTNIKVESQTIEYLTNPAKLKEDIGKAKDEIEAVGAVAKAAFNTIGSKEKNGFLDFLRTERVQETVRNLGYIDTKGKTKEQIAQEMQDKYGEIFAKNGKKLEINFYVNSEVSQDDPDAKNKMNAAGFTAEDGSIWLNADNISSMNNFDLNSVFAHEGTHKVTGKNTELLADFGQSRAEKFINKSIDKGYLARTGGGLNWEDGNLTEEQKQRLAKYTNEDMQYFLDGLLRGIGGDKAVNKLQDTTRKGVSKFFGKSGENAVNYVINLDKKFFNNEGKAVGNAIHNGVKKGTGVDTRKLGDQVVNVVENIQNGKPVPKKRSTKKTPPKKNTTNSNNSNNKKNNNIKEKIKNGVETGLEIGRETVINGGYFFWGGVLAIAEDATLGVAVVRDREGNKLEPNNKFYYAGQLTGHLLTTFGGTGGAVGGTEVEIVAIGASPETVGISMVATIPAEAVKTYSAGVATKGAFGIAESLIKLSNPKNSSNTSGSTNNKNSNTDNNPKNNSKQNHNSGITNNTNSTAFTSNRNISASKIRNNGVKLDVPKDLKSKITDIAQKGDYKGFKTEEVVNEILKRDPNVELLDGGKYGSNNGFDHVFRNKKTGEIWVLDSKQIAKSGNMSVSNKGAGGARQMSPNWVNNVLNKLENNNPVKHTIENAKNSGKLNTGLVGVDKKTGELIFVPVRITK
ncbi:hypothetical protein JMUB3935_2277 [Leptotrichia trevisanii]|uniref:Uncharacterized protein n=1 Tax=Leptotrichia trevisanii TaxID=109328 RepID=A0A510KNJ8_9FUSO|nr:hemagglutinin repeat-containing protein [Leptotrichia trevisanii]BBM53290.1 hypothetical protein JMUB3935_2277 [Leptotrichia trevisanii]